MADKDNIDGVQSMMTDALRARYEGRLPEWLDMHPTPAGNTRLVIDTRTGKSMEVGLCNLHGFLDALIWMN